MRYRGASHSRHKSLLVCLVSLTHLGLFQRHVTHSHNHIQVTFSFVCLGTEVIFTPLTPHSRATVTICYTGKPGLSLHTGTTTTIFLHMPLEVCILFQHSLCLLLLSPSLLLLSPSLLLLSLCLLPLSPCLLLLSPCILPLSPYLLPLFLYLLPIFPCRLFSKCGFRYL